TIWSSSRRSSELTLSAVPTPTGSVHGGGARRPHNVTALVTALVTAPVTLPRPVPPRRQTLRVCLARRQAKTGTRKNRPPRPPLPKHRRTKPPAVAAHACPTTSLSPPT